jgi:hypothetical protein
LREIRIFCIWAGCRAVARNAGRYSLKGRKELKKRRIKESAKGSRKETERQMDALSKAGTL